MAKSIDRRQLIAGGAALGLPLISGCSLPLPGGPGPQLYTLSPKSTYPEGLPRVNAQLLVEEPVAASGINTARVVLKPDPFRIDYYASVAWADRAPHLVQTLMIESFENSRKIVSVGRETTGLRADFILKSELREFQAEYYNRDTTNAPDINVRISATLIQMPQRAIIDRFEADYEMTAASNRFGDVIRGFDEALGKVLSRLVRETLIAMDQA